jgi:hypothetical protein
VPPLPQLSAGILAAGWLMDVYQGWIGNCLEIDVLCLPLGRNSWR